MHEKYKLACKSSFMDICFTFMKIIYFVYHNMLVINNPTIAHSFICGKYVIYMYMIQIRMCVTDILVYLLNCMQIVR